MGSWLSGSKADAEPAALLQTAFGKCIAGNTAAVHVHGSCRGELAQQPAAGLSAPRPLIHLGLAAHEEVEAGVHVKGVLTLGF